MTYCVEWDGPVKQLEIVMCNGGQEMHTEVNVKSETNITKQIQNPGKQVLITYSYSPKHEVLPVRQ